MRDGRGSSPSPKLLGQILESARTELAPETPVAGVQAIWNRIVGDRIAEVTEVVGEHEGVLTIDCQSAVWTQELDLMSPRIIARLKQELGDSAPEKLKFRTST